MADNSNFVIRWEIDNARARFATGKVESEVFNEGGYKWAFVIDQRSNENGNPANFAVKCDVDHNFPWKNEVEVSMHLLRTNGSVYDFPDKHRENFNEDGRVSLQQTHVHWSSFTEPSIMNSNKTTLEYRIKIIISETTAPIVDLSKFATPNSMSNVTLKIGESNLHVSKEKTSVRHSIATTSMMRRRARGEVNGLAIFLLRRLIGETNRRIQEEPL